MKTVTVGIFRFTVEGTGDFPVDMLRYDHCSFGWRVLR